MDVAWDVKRLHVTQLNEIVAAVEALNYDAEVVGVVLARPTVPAHVDLRSVHEAVAPAKDIEGQSPTSIGRCVYGTPVLWPCTARAAVELCATAVPDLKGLEALVVGTTDVVGKPVASILHARGATVTTCPADAPRLPVRARSADAVFVCQGSRDTITGDMLKPGCILIDLGMRASRVPVVGVGDAANTNSAKLQVQGIADVDSCLPVVSKIATITRGVAKLRTAYLFANLATAAEIQAGLRDPARATESFS